MTEGFETQLEAMFAIQPDLPDVAQFAAQVEYELDKGFRRLVFVGTALGVIAMGLTVPIMGGVLAQMAHKATQTLEQTRSLSLDASLSIAAGMMVIGGIAALYGRSQAAEV